VIRFRSVRTEANRKTEWFFKLLKEIQGFHNQGPRRRAWAVLVSSRTIFLQELKKPLPFFFLALGPELAKRLPPRGDFPPLFQCCRPGIKFRDRAEPVGNALCRIIRRT